MATESNDFIIGTSSTDKEDSSKDLTLHYVHPLISENKDISTVLTTNNTRQTKITSENNKQLEDDGLYVSSKYPLTDKVIKPYPSVQRRISNNENTKKGLTGKLLEVAIRDVIIHSENETTEPAFVIKSVAILFKEKVICKCNSPFNRKLYKFLLRRSTDFNYFSIKIYAKDRSCSCLPLPFPKHCVKNRRLEIDFAITSQTGQVHSGIVICTISLTNHGIEMENELSYYTTCIATNDPNNPQGSVSLLQWKSEFDSQPKNYFSLIDPALHFEATVVQAKHEDAKKNVPELLDIVVLEQSFSFMDLFGNWCGVERPPRPSFGSFNPKQYSNRKQVLMITILRGIEVPVREESALVQPLVEIEWCNVVHSTTAADGPAPVWQQTIQFETSRLSGEQSLKLRLFDDHPVWGLQWLGEAQLPLECHYHYQEVERWIGLSPLHSPKVLYGYVQASPGYSYTRIYVLLKMHQMGIIHSVDAKSVDTLSKAIQSCLVVPYKIDMLEAPEDVSRIVTLLSPLPPRYGPVKPKQALNLNKVDHYGRAALLSTLLRGLGFQSYVLLGTSQIMRLAAYCITIDESSNTLLWDPETGDHYDLNDSHCSLITVLRLIDHKTIWENTQKSVIPSQLKYDPKTNKDWQPLNINSEPNDISVQILNLNDSNNKNEQEADEAGEMEKHLKECLTQWRDTANLSTKFNKHADAILRAFLTTTNEVSSKSQFDKKKMRQLYRAFFIHGFLTVVRYTTLEELSNLLFSTKSHLAPGPVEFSVACYVQRHVGKIRSISLAVLILQSRTS